MRAWCFKLILLLAVLYSTTAYAQLNEFKENKARIDKDRQLLVKNKFKGEYKYWMRIRLGKLTGDSSLAMQYYFDGKGKYLKSVHSEQDTQTGKVTTITDNATTDANGNIIGDVFTNEFGVVKKTPTLKYSYNGLLVSDDGSVYQYDSLANVVEVRHANNTINKYEYNSKDQILKKWILTAKYPRPLLLDEYQYKQTDTGTIQYKTIHNLNDTVTTHYETYYDLHGRKTISYEVINGEKKLYSQTKYNRKGDIIEDIAPWYSTYYFGLQRKNLAEHTFYTYDAGGDVATVTKYQKDLLTGTETLFSIEKNYFYK